MSEEFDDLEIVLNDAPELAASSAQYVRIHLDAGVRQRMVEFADSDTSRELGGMLIGTLREGETPEIFITAMIEARHTDSSAASLTFTHETWQEIHAVKDRLYPNTKILGWFHTHPSFGIFLSNYDLHIHRHFFDLDWQVAYVIDPLAHTEGFFRWEQGSVQKTEAYDITGALPAPPSPAQAPPPTPPRFDLRDAAVAALLVASIYLAAFHTPEPTVVTMMRPPLPHPMAPKILPPVPIRPPAPRTEPRDWPVYTVQPNDSLWSISAAWYGDGLYYPLLMSANHLRTAQVRAGMRLVIPGGRPPRK